jgi:signal transduction histidine kinase
MEALAASATILPTEEVEGVEEWAIATTGVLVLATLVIAHRELRSYLIWQQAVRLRAQARQVIDRRLDQLGDRLDAPELAPILAIDLTNRDTSAIVVTRKGQVIGSAPPIHGPEPPLLPWPRYEAALEGEPHVTSVVQDGARRVLVVLIPPLAWRPAPGAVVELATYLDSEERLLRFIRILAGGVLLSAILAVFLEVALAGAYTLLALLAVPLVYAAARLARREASPPLTQESAPTRHAENETSEVDLAALMKEVEAAFLVRDASEERMRRFFADASHELRTPLTSLGAAADVLDRAKESPEQLDRVVDVLRSQTDRMTRTVQDMLVLTRLDSAVTFRRQPIRLDVLAIQHVDELALSTPDRTIEVDAGESVTVLGDEEQLRQALGNLTGNAVRHTAAGGHIVVAVSVEGKEAVVEVSDDGEGISEADLPWIFQRFYRADSTRLSGGSGLGLAIVRQIVERHGGEIEVSSSPREGAIFRIRLPVVGAVDRVPGGAASRAPASRTSAGD